MPLPSVPCRSPTLHLPHHVGKTQPIHKIVHGLTHYKTSEFSLCCTCCLSFALSADQTYNPGKWGKLFQLQIMQLIISSKCFPSLPNVLFRLPFTKNFQLKYFLLFGRHLFQNNWSLFSCTQMGCPSRSTSPATIANPVHVVQV